MRDVAVSVVIRVMEASERVIVRRPFDSHIINPDFLERLKIVVHDHSSSTDDGHLTNFPRLQPTASDCRKTIISKREGHIGYVLNPRGDVGIPLAVHDDGILSK